MTELAPPLKLAAFATVLAVTFVVAVLLGNAVPDLRDGGGSGGSDTPATTVHGGADHGTGA